MANLKDLKGRISSVKKTQKITSAMKMVAAAKLRRAQEGAEQARPYAERMNRMLTSIAKSVGDTEGAPKMLAGTGGNRQLYVVCASDRGLCGGFNGSIVRETRRRLRECAANGTEFKIVTVGRKSRDLLRREFNDKIVASFTDIGRRGVEFDEAVEIAAKITEMFEADEFDVCTVIYNKFQSAISQIVTPHQLIPFAVDEAEEAEEDKQTGGARAVFIFEPDEEEILEDLLPRNIATQIFQALLESSASEHGARMTAMDNATRNAGDMIDNLTMTYNRTRQAVITKELIEIISGAEAL
ncbi:MAG: F0F1 ATP synthase subunit gamma [Rhodospirillales bacterium]|nr:F0F1 ATP synthase subunit gamma [Rhodospirillales bacterium]MBO6788106.1 F0F1 ATP synthase subunit gamma [Rhodospirillales bacterium]